MKARLGRQTVVRSEPFGGICYVHHRNDFFALDESWFEVATTFTSRWKTVPIADVERVCKLAEFGIVETNDPSTEELAYSGASLIGLEVVPYVSRPLVLNCFSTAFCPLKCIYCHANDLMKKDIQEQEDSYLVSSVARTAIRINPMVAVITGGDPITRPERTSDLINKLKTDNPRLPLVLDTSGAGDLLKILPVLKSANVHVRVSLDAITSVNKITRPINSRFLPKGSLSRDFAVDAIRTLLSAGIPTTVQTVLSARNGHLDELWQLRNFLVNEGVRHWVIHSAICAGKAKEIEDRVRKNRLLRGSVLPSFDMRRNIRAIVDDTTLRRLKLDIRCTEDDHQKNCVFLVASDGNLFTEGEEGQGKRLLSSATADGALSNKDLSLINMRGHAIRYLNFLPWLHSSSNLI